MAQNPLRKFRSMMALEVEKREPDAEKPARQEVVPLNRRLLRPRARIKGKKVEATEVREFHDPSRGWQVEEKRHRAYGNRDVESHAYNFRNRKDGS